MPSAVLRTLSDLFGALRALLVRLLAHERRGPSLGPRPRYTWLVLIAVLVAIPLWQRRFWNPEGAVPTNVTVTASTGVHGEASFFFFLYHLGLYPAKTLAPIKEDTKAEALRQVQENAKSLMMDDFVTFRSGDRGRVFLYYPDVWLHHDARTPSLRTANALGFVVALAALFVSFWWIRRPWLGGLLVLFLGSNPFQLYAVYRQENVFCWAITIAMIMLAMHLPLMVSRKEPRPWSMWLWWLPIVAGLVLATARTVRSEGSLVAASITLVYLTLPNARWWKRAALAAMFVVTLSTATRAYSSYFVRRAQATEAVIVRHGGTPYAGPIAIYHEFWHAVFCGLGDFDTKYGYAWDDVVAYRYAIPILQQQYGLKWHWPGHHSVYEETYDAEKKYPIFVSEAPHYHDVIRDKILGDIRRDPKWFLAILEKRTWRVLTTTSPISVHAWLDEPLSTVSALLGVLCLPLAALLALTRRWTLLKLLLFPVPLSAPALLVYSDRGMTNYSLFHYVGAVVFAALACEGIRAWMKKPADD